MRYAGDLAAELSGHDGSIMNDERGLVPMKFGPTKSPTLAAATALVSLCTALHAVHGQSAVLLGRVVADSAGAPVPLALVELPALGIAARTDSAGKFRMNGVPGGDHVISIRVIGYDLLVSQVRLGARDTLEIEFEMGRTMTRLATVRTTASGPSLITTRLAEFEARRQTGLGRFFSADFFAPHPGRSIASLLVGRIPGIRVSGSGMSESITIGRGSRCTPRIIVNGLAQRTTLGTYQTTEIIGLEYHTAGTVPIEYAGACATIILWTK
jgi:hypothetical protein